MEEERQDWNNHTPSCSEAVVICCDKLKHLIEVSEALKDAVLKHCVELVLNTSEESSLFIDIEA